MELGRRRRVVGRRRVDVEGHLGVLGVGGEVRAQDDDAAARDVEERGDVVGDAEREVEGGRLGDRRRRQVGDQHVGGGGGAGGGGDPGSASGVPVGSGSASPSSPYHTNDGRERAANGVELAVVARAAGARAVARVPLLLVVDAAAAAGARVSRHGWHQQPPKAASRSQSARSRACR